MPPISAPSVSWKHARTYGNWTDGYLFYKSKILIVRLEGQGIRGG
jgi:hypothetical protein